MDIRKVLKEAELYGEYTWLPYYHHQSDLGWRCSLGGGGLRVSKRGRIGVSWVNFMYTVEPPIMDTPKSGQPPYNGQSACPLPTTACTPYISTSEIRTPLTSE